MLNFLSLVLTIVLEFIIVIIEYFWSALWITPMINYALTIAGTGWFLPLWVIPAVGLLIVLSRGYQTGPLTSLSKYAGILVIVREYQRAGIHDQASLDAEARHAYQELTSAMLFPVVLALIGWICIGILA